MPRDAVSRTANVERNGGHKWVKEDPQLDIWLGGKQELLFLKHNSCFIMIQVVTITEILI